MLGKMPKYLLLPKYWGIWLLLGLLYLLVRFLPYPFLIRLGGFLGIIMEKIMPYRFLIAKINIKLCFENSNKDWEKIYKDHVKSVGIGVFEISMGWFVSAKKIEQRVSYSGIDNIDNAIKKGKGVLFLGVHTTGLDFGVPLINSRCNTSFMYKSSKNPIFNYISLRGRLKSCSDVIRHTNMREVIRKLRNGECVWYGCDQDFGHWTNSVFVPFFGVQAFTLPSYAKIAKKTGASVIPVVCLRDNNTGRYIAKYLPEIKVERDITDKQAALLMNKNIEKMFSNNEDQYYWIHRRFKTRPEGELDIYPKKPSQLRRERSEAKTYK